MADKLSEFGYNFQIKLIASLFTDRAYLQQISDILEPNMFESEANYFIVDTIKKYFQTYKSPPTMEVMKVQVEEIDNDVLKTTVVDHLKDSYKQLESDVLLAMIWVNGMVQGTFLGGQSFVDALVRRAVAKNGQFKKKALIIKGEEG